MDGKLRKNVAISMKVNIVEKQNQRSGKTTEGIVQKILTNSGSHPWGIKVKLKSGKVGRIKQIIHEPAE
ncbi:MAG: YwbE family protein [Candidatus Kariarchaeaceae archaeon]|jgi:uncharacterized repeat protein (TIGR03833 family)